MMTGILPSEQRPWLERFGGEKAREVVQAPVGEISMWQYLESRLRMQGDRYPALSYFGKKVSRSEFISNVHRWGHAFRAAGIKADDKVVVFAPFTPEVASVIMALNCIGAWPILPNLSSCMESVREVSQEASLIVVADAVEGNISPVLREFVNTKRIMLTSVFTDMPLPLRLLSSLKSGFLYRRILRRNPGYLSADSVLGKWRLHDGQLAPAYDRNRPALVTSSGGTSAKGYAKQIMDTNEAVIRMMNQCLLSNICWRYSEGSVCYTCLPPFVSTSMFALFYAPLFLGMICLLDPRAPGEVFIRNVLKHRPQVTLIPGECWIRFFTHVCELEKKGARPDLSFFQMPILGGEGVSVKDLKWMDDTLRRCGSTVGLASGYGMSEVFSIISLDDRDGFHAMEDEYPVITVGYPMPAVTVGIFDEDGNELLYGQRGEIRVRTTTMMRGYYYNEELTEKMFKNGWLCSGDLGFLDEDGKLYVLCRISDKLQVSEESWIYPVDIELAMNADPEVRCSIVNNMADQCSAPRLAAHIVTVDGCRDTEALIRRLDAGMRKVLPDGIEIEGYKVYSGSFRMSNVCKTDRNYYRNDREGYIKPEGNALKTVSFN